MAGAQNFLQYWINRFANTSASGNRSSSVIGAVSVQYAYYSEQKSSLCNTTSPELFAKYPAHGYIASF
jgi:hypothetical protein